MNRYCLGIDTSNYKTSVAVTDLDGSILFSRSEFLEVEQGSRGLRQSTAFFKHVNALPSFIEEAIKFAGRENIGSVAVSNAPRRVEGSYMPVFRAGCSAAEILSAALGVPLYRFSHQEGHIEAIIHPFASEIKEDRVLFYHLSGGTTECLLCTRNGVHIDAEIVGGTKDISIGQLLDRSGVALGYPFPAGGFLDMLAKSREIDGMPGRIKCDDGYFNLSGIETQMMRSIETDGDRLVPGLFRRITELLYDVSSQLTKKYGLKEVYMAGGVSASDTLRKDLSAMCEEDGSFSVRFGDKMFSGDNAVGISLLGGMAYNEACNSNSDK